VPSAVDVVAAPSAALEAAVARLMPDAGPLRWSALSGGVSSDIWRIEGPTGVFCVKRALPRLKVADDWFAPVRRNREEVKWLRFAATVAPAQVPRVIAADDDAGIAILSWFEPGPWQNWKQLMMANQVRPALGADAGRLLAALHRASYRRDDLAAAFDNLDLFEALRLAPYFGRAGERNPEVAVLLAQLCAGLATHRTALVHGDFSPKNMLVHHAHPLVLLDAECACYSDPAFDVAFLMSHLLLKTMRLKSVRPWLYDTLRRFEAEYAAAAPEPVDARTRLLLPALLLARVDGSSPVEYLDFASAAYVRETALQALEDPKPTMAFVAAWADANPL
jgi:aminoglycoside phosphotransferase (APT) family kinase protein